MTATTSLRERLLAEADKADKAARRQAEASGFEVVLFTGSTTGELLREAAAALSTPPAGELRALAHDMGMFLNRYRAVLPSQAMAESYALHNRLNALAWNAASTPEPATQEVG